MDALVRIFTVLSVPIGIINLLGGFISGIWLAVLGHWGLIGYGFLLGVFGAFGIGLAMMPGLFLFAMPAASLIEKGNKFFGYIFGLLATVYTYGILTLWCLLILFYYVSRADQDSIIPVLLWSYGVTTGPIAYMAMKEQNEFSMISTFFIQIAYLISMFAVYFGGFIYVLYIFGVTMLVGLLIQFTLAFLMDKERSY
ncbi:hypothetical protein N8Z26_06915 [Burkholderiales bacterium]|jgi:hypothetical protein|nr:hypothetical protein [Burkholderiales bacterium]